jgi:hypothetical protein
MTRSKIDVLLERHRESFASRSVSRLTADHAEEGVFESPAAGIVTGRPAITGVYEYWLRAFPDLDFSWRDPIVEGNRVALFWHFRGTLAGEFFGEPHVGKRVEFDGAADYDMSPEGIVRARHVFDFTGALIAAGVLKVKPS